MSEPARPIHFTADEFIAWAMDRPEGEHAELASGELVRMASERVVHARTKLRIMQSLLAAVRASGRPCMAVDLAAGFTRENLFPEA